MSEIGKNILKIFAVGLVLLIILQLSVHLTLTDNRIEALLNAKGVNTQYGFSTGDTWLGKIVGVYTSPSYIGVEYYVSVFGDVQHLVTYGSIP